MDLVHCIYCSALAVEGFGPEELKRLLIIARENNAKCGVTGILLFQAGSFFQILEGERPTVEALYEKIAGDSRHAKVTKLILEPISKRDFAEWTMGYPKLSAQELSEIPGLNDFFQSGVSFATLDPGSAKTLLSAFKEGKWRSRLA